MSSASSNLATGMAAEAEDRLDDALAYYAAALDADEPATAEEALNAGLTFFEAKDLGVVAASSVRHDLYFDVERCSAWLRRAVDLGSPCAEFWMHYDNLIYGDGKEFPELATTMLAQGCSDALLVLFHVDPPRYTPAVERFAATLRARKTYRERYLYSILGPYFDPEHPHKRTFSK